MAENEITISSIDAERTKILRDKTLTVVRWNQEKALSITDPDESVAHALKRYINENGLRNKEIHFREFDFPVRFTQATLKESVSQMTKQKADLLNLGKMLSVIDYVCENAVKIDVEPYRHIDERKKNIKQVTQMLSAFHDGDKIYPVKISIQESERDNKFHMVVTVGNIDVPDKMKEALTNTGVERYTTNESLSAGGTSFKISIAEFIRNFNRDETILLKNLPDGMLDKEQKHLKKRVIDNDAEKNKKQPQIITGQQTRDRQDMSSTKTRDNTDPSATHTDIVRDTYGKYLDEFEQKIKGIQRDLKNRGERLEEVKKALKEIYYNDILDCAGLGEQLDKNEERGIRAAAYRMALCDVYSFPMTDDRDLIKDAIEALDEAAVYEVLSGKGVEFYQKARGYDEIERFLSLSRNERLYETEYNRVARELTLENRVDNVLETERNRHTRAHENPVLDWIKSFAGDERSDAAEAITAAAFVDSVRQMAKGELVKDYREDMMYAAEGIDRYCLNTYSNNELYTYFGINELRYDHTRTDMEKEQLAEDDRLPKIETSTEIYSAILNQYLSQKRPAEEKTATLQQVSDKMKTDKTDDRFIKQAAWKRSLKRAYYHAVNENDKETEDIIANAITSIDNKYTWNIPPEIKLLDMRKLQDSDVLKKEISDILKTDTENREITDDRSEELKALSEQTSYLAAMLKDMDDGELTATSEFASAVMDALDKVNASARAISADSRGYREFVSKSGQEAIADIRKKEESLQNNKHDEKKSEKGQGHDDDDYTR